MRDAVLVTGVAGFIGFHVARRLLEQGRAVVGIDHLEGAYYDPALKQARRERLEAHDDFRFLRWDLADAELDLCGAPELDACRAVIHLAARASVPDSFVHSRACYRDNVLGFQPLLALYEHRALDCLVYASSSSVYGRSEPGVALREERVLAHPLSPYGASKIANEAMAQASFARVGRPVVGLRLFKVYGPWARPDTVFFRFTEAIARGRPVTLRNFGDIVHSFTYVDDVVTGVLAALEHRPAGSADHPRFNLGSPVAEPLADCVDLIEGYLGRPAERELVPLPAGDRAHSLADVSRSEAALGFRASTTVDRGLAAFVRWYREEYLPLGLRGGADGPGW